MNILRSFHIISNKKLIIFGTGSTCKKLLAELPITVCYFVDNDEKRQEKYFENTIVESPQKLLTENKEDIAILVASQFFPEIAHQLTLMGFEEQVHYWDGYKLLNAITGFPNIDKLENLIYQCMGELRHQREIADMRYRDILEVLRFSPKYLPRHLVDLEAVSTIAETSLDHLCPRGTAADNTRWPAFVHKCETLFAGTISYLDLGCSGGGLVFDFALRGHFAMGLEGSDYSLKRLRAEWRTLPDNLYTCDIAKPFVIRSQKDRSVHQFHIITAWDVLEHISEEGLCILLASVKTHLLDSGYFIGSISTRLAAAQAGELANHHVTVRSKNWWMKFFADNFFIDGTTDAGFVIEEFPRGSGNFNDPLDFSDKPEEGFHFVLKLQQ